MPKQNTTNAALYGGGVTLTRAGHLRYTSPASLRGQYVHRVTVQRQIAETPWSVRLLLPWPYEVHHADYNKQNNSESGNLIMVSESLHSAMTADRPRGRRGEWGSKRSVFDPRWSAPPEWVLFDETSVEEIPF